RAVSHLPIQHPFWSRLPSEETLYPSPPLLARDTIPLLVPLDETALCRCDGVDHPFVPTMPTITRQGTLLGMSQTYSLEIELQVCPSSSSKKAHYIGPDPRNTGIFNYNNSVLFTHELLEDYTSQYTASETPFASWVLVTSRRYISNSSPNPFIGVETFRLAWFAYVNLQIVNGDMTCPICGPNPRDTIWDGVTLAFSRKHL
ncbi:hypothetical protein BDN72DRAFT_752988, partial [Pluteus cervinus]